MLLKFFFTLSFISCADKHTEPYTETLSEDTSTIKRTSPSTGEQKLVSLGGNITEIIFALGEGKHVVAVDASSLYPKEVTEIPKVGYYRQVSSEGILSAEPSMVIASESAGPKEVIEQIKKIGISVLQVPSEKSLEGTERRIRQIATTLNKEKEGIQLIKQIHEDLKKIQESKTTPKVLFIYARGGGTLSVAGRNTAAAEMISLAGGINAVQEYEGYKPLNAESIIIAAPDYILLTTRGLTSLGSVEDVLSLKGIAQTPAAQNKKIISMDDLLLLGFGPRTGKAALELSKLLKD